MNPRENLSDRRSASAAILFVLAALVGSATFAVAASASPPQNAAAFNEVGGLPTITAGTAGAVTCTACGASTPLVGGTLTAASGTWSEAPAPVSFAYQWRRCNIDGTACSDITGATSATYKVATADVTHVLVVKVTAFNGDGSGTATSAPTGIVASASGPQPVALPTLTGSVIIGKQLSVSNGVWSPAASSYAVQWQRCSSGTASSTVSGVTYTATGAAVGCLNVAGATSPTYSITANDLNHRIRVIVTAAISTGDAASAISNTSGLTLKAIPKKKKK